MKVTIQMLMAQHRESMFLFSQRRGYASLLTETKPLCFVSFFNHHSVARPWLPYSLPCMAFSWFLFTLSWFRAAVLFSQEDLVEGYVSISLEFSPGQIPPDIIIPDNIPWKISAGH